MEQKHDQLEIRNLHVSVDGQEILKGVDLTITAGEIHIIMGPNGSGKSTLCYALMGHPRYEVTEGEVTLNGENILALAPDKRAHLGLFLGFQYPREVPGVTFGNFMRMAVNTVSKARNADFKPIGVAPFYRIMQDQVESVHLDKKFIGRHLNEGFSGGEKKRAEIIQMSLLKPSIAMLDEIDSGLDIDALKIVAEGIGRLNRDTGSGIMLITHYQRILQYLKPDFVHVMAAGKVILSGDHELALQLERDGYEKIIAASV